MSEFRHEYKYIVDAVKETMICASAQCVLSRDSHADENGRYLIRSLYFDDAFDSCMRENEIGSDPRWKYRIRYYDSNLSYISLEKKSKVCGMTKKTSCRMTPEEVELLCECRGAEILDRIAGGKRIFEEQLNKKPLDKKSLGMKSLDEPDRTKFILITEMVQNGLKPKVIVTYEREPFVYEAGNVRVTFDRHISSSTDLDRFLTGDYFQRPVMPTGRSILEVKWDEILPKHIQDTLLIKGLTQTAYSKYYMCRKYH